MNTPVQRTTNSPPAIGNPLRLLGLLLGVLTLLVMMVAACSSDEAPTSPPPPSSEQLMLAYQDALVAKDLAKFADILTEDFVFTQVPGPGGTEMLTVNGRSAFMVRLGGQMENNTVMTPSETVFEGDNATGKFSITADNFSAIGIDALTGTFQSTGREGKLARLATVIDGPSLQKLGAALAAMAPPSAEDLNMTYFEALTSKDLAKFADMLTDDFVFTQVPGPGGTEQLTVTGKSAYMVRLAGQMENNTLIIDSEGVVDGDKASGKYSLTADNLRAIGIDALSGTYEATTRDGKLASLATVIDGPSLQKLGAAMAAMAPPSAEALNMAYFEALTSKNLAKFADILTDDFVFTQVPGGTEQLTVTGKSAYMVRLAGQMENNTLINDSEGVVDGDKASGKYSLTADNLRAIGIDALSGTYEATTRDGKLASLATFIDGPSLQKLGAALAALAPPSN